MTDLGTFGGTWSSATGINDQGQIVGNFWPTTGGNHAFLYTSGTAIDLGLLPGYTSSFAEGINDNGDVVGYVSGVGIISHAYLYTGGA